MRKDSRGFFSCFFGGARGGGRSIVEEKGAKSSLGLSSSSTVPYYTSIEAHTGLAKKARQLSDIISPS